MRLGLAYLTNHGRHILDGATAQDHLASWHLEVREDGQGRFSAIQE